MTRSAPNSRHACSAPRQYSPGASYTPLPWMGSATKAATSPVPSAPRARRGRRRGPRSTSASRGPKPSWNAVPPLSESAPSVRPWYAWAQVHDPGAPRERSGELDRGLDGLGARVAEVDALEMPGPLREQSASARSPGNRAQSIWTMFGRSRSIAWCSAALMAGWQRPSANTPKPLNKSRYRSPWSSIEPWALAAHVGAVEAEGPKDPRQLGVEVRLMQRELLALMCTERGVDVEGQPDLLVERA